MHPHNYTANIADGVPALCQVSIRLPQELVSAKQVAHKCQTNLLVVITPQFMQTAFFREHAAIRKKTFGFYNFTTKFRTSCNTLSANNSLLNHLRPREPSYKRLVISCSKTAAHQCQQLPNDITIHASWVFCHPCLPQNKTIKSKVTVLGKVLPA